MGFHGYWFNKHKNKYLTFKYPHCYVGIKQKSYINWGSYVKITDLKHYVNWGDYGGDTLTHSVSNFTLDDTGTFLVEKTWHKATGLNPTGGTPPLNTNFALTDANGVKMSPWEYVIDIYYKIIIPADSSTDQVGKGKRSIGKIYNTGFGYSAIQYTTEYIAEALGGSATLYSTDGTPHYSGAIFGRHPSKDIMSLPNDKTLGYDDSFPTGTPLQSFGDNNDLNFWVPIYKGPNGLGDNGWCHSFLNTNVYNNAKIPTMLSGCSYNGDNCTYTIDLSSNTLGVWPKLIPSNLSRKYFMPELFTGFVMTENHREAVTTGMIGVPDPYILPDVAALYLCLGVHKL